MLFNESGGKIWDYNLCNVGKSFNSVFFVKTSEGVMVNGNGIFRTSLLKQSSMLKMNSGMCLRRLWG